MEARASSVLAKCYTTELHPKSIDFGSPHTAEAWTQGLIHTDHMLYH
jgi:hypothetical protein